MNSIRGLMMAVGLSVLSLGTMSISRAATDARLPNIIVFLADDLGWGDLGCYGHPFIKTPNLDRLAEQGLRLTDCHAGAAICSPSRGALLTGRAPARLGIYSLCNRGVHLRDEEITVAEILKKAGYSTFFAGKWHLGSLTSGKEPLPGEQGFDRWIAKEKGRFITHSLPAPYTDNASCDEVTKYAIDMIKERDRRVPFFLEICSREPHEPITPAPEYAAMYDNERVRSMEHLVRRGGVPLPPWQLSRPELSRQYYGTVTQLDNAVGTLMKALDEMGLTENTLFIFTSDNGPELHEWIFPNRKTYGSTGGYRGAKRFLYEGGIRVPGIIHWPARIKPGRVSDALVSSVDLLPTFCELAGEEIPQDRVIDGISLLPLFDGKELTRTKPLLWHGARTDIPQFSMRIGDEALIAYIDPPQEGQTKYKWLRNNDIDLVEYFDLSIDPFQEVELSEYRSERFAQLKEVFLQFVAALRDDMYDWKDLNKNYTKPVSAMVNWNKGKWQRQIRKQGPFTEKMRRDDHK